MNLSFYAFLKILLDGKSSKRFLLGVIASFAFSISVILSTIGLMDGFEATLVKSLQNSNSDLILKKTNGFFLFDDEIKNLKKEKTVLELTPITQVEAFAITGENSTGVLVKGIESKSFSKTTGLDFKVQDENIAIGKELSKKYDLKIGDVITLTFASNQKRNQGAPILRAFEVSSIVEHGVFEKDMRFIYISRDTLLKTLNYREGTTNLVLLKTIDYENLDILDAYRINLLSKIGPYFSLSTFWDEFKVLLEAVEVQKFSISLILQLIVIVAIFNIVAFIIFISEKKSQEFFLLRVLGINLKSVVRFWFLMLIFLWGISAFLSIFLTKIFNYLIGNLSFFELPGDVYVLSKLQISLGLNDYFIVFSLSLLWVLLIGIFSILKLRKKTLLQGLRQEFS